MAFNLQTEGTQLVNIIKQSSWFPYHTGNLKFNATWGLLLDPHTFLIHFDSIIAPYITYLEEGTSPHDIPGAFGRKLKKDGTPFGIGGRFDGKFHPGSQKHRGFISEKSVNAIVNYFTNKYKGMVVEVSK